MYPSASLDDGVDRRRYSLPDHIPDYTRAGECECGGTAFGYAQHESFCPAY